MAIETGESGRVSLEGLRNELDDSQRYFYDLFWEGYLNTGLWPRTFDVHKKHDPAEIEKCLRPLGGIAVFESQDSQRGNCYQLHLIGILLTKGGVEYEGWIVRMLEFLRGRYFDENNQVEEFDSDAIREALKLTPEECKVLGTVTRSHSNYRSHGHSTDGKWQIRFPTEIQHIPRTGSLRAYHEDLLLKHFKRDLPIFERDRFGATVGNSTFFKQPDWSGEDGLQHILGGIKSQKPKSKKSPKIFVSHSSQDLELVKALTDLVKAAFRLSAKDILCTSVPGHKLAGGADTEEELRDLLDVCELLIGVLTPASLSSSYVLFELGARWGLKKAHIPLVACGASMSDIKEPLKSKNVLNAADEDDVHQLIEDIERHLGIPKEPASAYNAKVRQVVALAKAQKIKVARTSPGLPSDAEMRLDWPRLIEEMIITAYLPKGGCKAFYNLAKRRGLEPFLEAPKDVQWCKLACAGVSIFESNGHRAVVDDSSMEYELRLSPEMWDKTAPVVERWNHGFGNSLLALRIRFSDGVTMEREAHRIKSNIFGTQLSMRTKDAFEFGKHWFHLGQRQGNWHPTFEMTLRKKIASIPWLEIFTALVECQVLLLEKSLLKGLRGSLPKKLPA